MTPTKSKIDVAETAGNGLPPFGQLAKTAVTILALPVAVLLICAKTWLALGVLTGAVIGIALFWSLHLISRLLVTQYLQDESDRSDLPRQKRAEEARRIALWRLAGMLLMKYAVLTAAMIGVFAMAKDNLIPFLLAFIGAFALTQITIVSAAARTMRGRR